MDTRMTMHGAGFALYHPPALDGEILDLSKKHHHHNHHHEMDVKPYLSPLPMTLSLSAPPPQPQPPPPQQPTAPTTRQDTQGELLYMLGQPPLSSPPPPPPSQAAASRPAKPTRPFKAYPKDPLSLSLGVTGNTDVLLGHDPNQAYAEFRRRMLEQVQAASRPPAQKRSLSPGPQQPSSSDAAADKESRDKDAAYWERRRKNNEAAKRSRDARRAKEDEIAIRAAFLEQENIKLRYEVAALRTETGKLRCLLYNR